MNKPDPEVLKRLNGPLNEIKREDLDAWSATLMIPIVKDVIQANTLVPTLNITLWQYVMMNGDLTTERLVLQCIKDYRMVPVFGRPDTFTCMGKTIQANLKIDRGDVLQFKPAFVEVQ